MRRVVVEDRASFNHSLDRVWRVITDFSSYPAWWPRSTHISVERVTPDLIGSVIAVRPFGRRGFHGMVERVVTGEELAMRYSDLFRGTGVWAPVASGARCHVCYRIDLEVTTVWLRWLSPVVPAAKLHSRLMADVYKGLEARLRQG
jgi:uncharacterized protein YndB with AHSA1/START domain